MPFYTNQLGSGKRHWNLETSSAVVEFPPPKEMLLSNDVISKEMLLSNQFKSKSSLNKQTKINSFY